MQFQKTELFKKLLTQGLTAIGYIAVAPLFLCDSATALSPLFHQHSAQRMRI